MLNKIFDKIYVINRKVDEDRKKNIINQFEKYNLKYDFFLATDKNDINKTEFENNNLINLKSRDLFTGQIACAISHYRVYLDIIEKKFQNALIIEDDLIIDDNSFQDIEKAYKSLPKDWNLIYFGYTSHIEGKEFKKHLIEKTTYGFFGTHLYAITNKCANILIENFLPIQLPQDDYIRDFIIQKNKINAYYSTKNIGKNGTGVGYFISIIG